MPALRMQPMFMFISMKLESWACARAARNCQDRGCRQPANPKHKCISSQLLDRPMRRVVLKGRSFAMRNLQLRELGQDLFGDHARDRDRRCRGGRGRIAHMQHPGGFREEKIMDKGSL